VPPPDGSAVPIGCVQRPLEPWSARDRPGPPTESSAMSAHRRTSGDRAMSAVIGSPDPRAEVHAIPRACDGLRAWRRVCREPEGLGVDVGPDGTLPPASCRDDTGKGRVQARRVSRVLDGALMIGLTNGCSLQPKGSSSCLPVPSPKSAKCVSARGRPRSSGCGSAGPWLRWCRHPVLSSRSSSGRSTRSCAADLRRARRPVRGDAAAHRRRS